MLSAAGDLLQPQAGETVVPVIDGTTLVLVISVAYGHWAVPLVRVVLR